MMTKIVKNLAHVVTGFKVILQGGLLAVIVGCIDAFTYPSLGSLMFSSNNKLHMILNQLVDLSMSSLQIINFLFVRFIPYAKIIFSSDFVGLFIMLCMCTALFVELSEPNTLHRKTSYIIAAITTTVWILIICISKMF